MNDATKQMAYTRDEVLDALAEVYLPHWEQYANLSETGKTLLHADKMLAFREVSLLADKEQIILTAIQDVAESLGIHRAEFLEVMANWNA